MDNLPFNLNSRLLVPGSLLEHILKKYMKTCFLLVKVHATVNKGFDDFIPGAVSQALSFLKVSEFVRYPKSPSRTDSPIFPLASTT